MKLLGDATLQADVHVWQGCSTLKSMYMCESSVLSSGAMWLGMYTVKATADVLQFHLLYIPDVTTEVLHSFEASTSATLCSDTFRGHDAGNMQSLCCQHLSA